MYMEHSLCKIPKLFKFGLFGFEKNDNIAYTKPNNPLLIWKTSVLNSEL